MLDLGSSPGGWSQVAAKKIKLGRILSVDIKEMEKIENVEFLCGDFLDLNIQRKIANFFSKKINVVISDMTSNTTGNKIDGHHKNLRALFGERWNFLRKY